MLKTMPVAENFADLEKVEALAKEAFPPKEYLAPAQMIEMAKSGGFDFLALYGEDAFVGFMAVTTYRDMAYLFFLAIEKAQRSKGYGAEALRLLRTLYPGKQQVVDMEMLEESAENESQRERRRRFYIRNGYRATGQFLSYLGVNYEVLCAGDEFDPGQFRESMKQIKIDGFAPDYFQRTV